MPTRLSFAGTTENGIKGPTSQRAILRRLCLLPCASIAALLQMTVIFALTGSALAQSATLTVGAQMDLWQAGVNVDGSDGVSPAMYSFPAAPGQTLTFSSVTGSWACAGYFFFPDGTTYNRFGTGGGVSSDGNQIIIVKSSSEKGTDYET